MPTDTEFLIPHTVDIVKAIIESQDQSPQELGLAITTVQNGLIDVMRRAKAFESQFATPIEVAGTRDLAETDISEQSRSMLAAMFANRSEDSNGIPVPPIIDRRVREEAPRAPDTNEQFALPLSLTSALNPERGRRVADRRKAEASDNVLKLPRNLRSVDEAVETDYIICLEDGKKVKDLKQHLQKRGITAAAYRKKWGLPQQYPMVPPSLILKKGEVREFDPATKEFRAA